MKTNYLFPSNCKQIGWCMFIPFFVLSILICMGILDDDFIKVTWFGYSDVPFRGIHIGMVKEGFLNEIAFLGLVISLFLISFAREKEEDEYIQSLRLYALVWAFKVDVILLIIANLTLYGLAFFYFMEVYLVLIFILFIFKFYCELYKLRRSDHEK